MLTFSTANDKLTISTALIPRSKHFTHTEEEMEGLEGKDEGNIGKRKGEEENDTNKFKQKWKRKFIT